MSYKTTKKDFAEFKKECEYWLEYFGLIDWEYFITHEEIQDQPDATASFNLDSVARNTYIKCAIKVNVKPLKNEIKTWAFHEVCHLLISGVTGLAWRSFNYDTAKHTF